MKVQMTIKSNGENHLRHNTGNYLTGDSGTSVLLHSVPRFSKLLLLPKTGKSPPGRSRSPGAGKYLDPDYKPAARKGTITITKSTENIFQINQNQYSSFYHN
jgi:hypothetical protein